MNVPFKQAYGPNVVLVLLTLFPQLINTAAYATLERSMARDLHVAGPEIGRLALFNEAAFIFGILIGTTLMRHCNIRPVYLVLLVLDVIVFTAMSFTSAYVVMIALNVFAGGLAGTFLMVALPPLFTNFEPKHFPVSAALMVPCLFGAATAAPLVTEPLAAGMLWRPLFWGEAVALACAFVLAVFTVGSKEAQEPRVPVDWYALIAGALGLACVFAGVQNATSHGWHYAGALVPFLVGIAAFGALLFGEARRENPLLPVKALLVAYAIVGIVGATFGNAIYIADIQIFDTVSRHLLHEGPQQIAQASWPLFAMTVAGGLLFAFVLRTKWVPLFTLLGLIAIAGGSALLLWNLYSPSAEKQRASVFLIGYGAATTITPGLFTVGLSLARQIIVKGIASVETFRLTVGFISGPLAEHTVVVRGGAQLAPLTGAMQYVIGFGVLGILGATALLLTYYRNPHRPDIERYIREGAPAFDSPSLPGHKGT